MKTKTKTETQAKPEARAIDARLAPLVTAFRADPRVTYGGKGFGSGALKVDGKMFALISSKGLFVVKLPKERVAELVRLGKGRHFDPGRGKRMLEWFETESKPSTWLALAKEAHRFVLAAAG